MKLLIPMLCLLFTCFSGFVNGGSISQRIAHGEDAQPGDAPFQVSIWENSRTSSQIICGGILYQANKVLTAAHCVEYGGSFFIRYGTLNHLKSNYTDIKVQQTIIHPNYKGGRKGDIAILVLESNAKNDSVVKFATLEENELERSDEVQIFGWGLTSSLSFPPENLQKATLIVKIIDSTSIYAVSNKSSACYGDSGGPMVSADGKAVGVAHGGSAECLPEHYSIYTKISEYISWINHN